MNLNGGSVVAAFMSNAYWYFYLELERLFVQEKIDSSVNVVKLVNCTFKLLLSDLRADPVKRKFPSLPPLCVKHLSMSRVTQARTT